MPISRVRSVTLTNMMFMTPLPPTSNPIEMRITITSATVLVMRRKSSIICSAEAKTGYRLDRLPVPATELTQALGRQNQQIPKGVQEPVQDSQAEIFQARGAPTQPAHSLPSARNRSLEVGRAPGA